MEAINSFSKEANISLLGSLPPLIMSYKTELEKNKMKPRIFIKE